MRWERRSCTEIREKRWENFPEMSIFFENEGEGLDELSKPCKTKNEEFLRILLELENLERAGQIIGEFVVSIVQANLLLELLSEVTLLDGMKIIRADLERLLRARRFELRFVKVFSDIGISINTVNRLINNYLGL